MKDIKYFHHTHSWNLEGFTILGSYRGDSPILAMFPSMLRQLNPAIVPWLRICMGGEFFTRESTVSRYERERNVLG